uniref:Cleavage and polyadenylation specificity factor subunit 2 n=1 Tax=Tanacetum cinerariifolium TaxID=118510 RepID=A0A699IRT2_TANCI|nr:cleavage and polyadenylation specificity factor subunit 2 [Tanacetum cinerariifolium]
MGTSVQVTPLCGVYNENPLSYLVSIDGLIFLSIAVGTITSIPNSLFLFPVTSTSSGTSKYLTWKRHA